MNHKILLAMTIITLTMISFNLSALIINRSEADSLVLQLLGNELTDINVYAHRSALINTPVFPLYRDLDTLSVPFNYCYMYFIDNCPEKYWSSSGRYAFVDIASSSMVIREKTRLPRDFSLWTYEAEYELISYSVDPANLRNHPQTDEINVNLTTSNIESHDNLYAVIIAPRFHDENPYGNENPTTNGEKPFQWRNVSLLYSTLVNTLGVKKENCIIMYDNDGISDMILDIDGDGLLEDVGNDFDGDGINDVDYPCKVADIDMVFKELSGTSNNVPTIPALTTADVLMVYTIGVGFGSEPGVSPYMNHPSLLCHEGGYMMTDEDWYLDSFEFAEYLSEVNCGHMSIALFHDHSGDFMAELSNNQHNFLCDNKVIITSCGVNETNANGMYGGWEYDYPGGLNVYGLYSEYLMYFVSAIRGSYPAFYDSDTSDNTIIDSSTPWLSGDAVGQRVFNQIHWHVDENNYAVHCVDFNPDVNNDFVTTVLEAHRYAKTHHNLVNYTYPEIGGENYCFMPVHYTSPPWPPTPDQVHPDYYASYSYIDHLYGLTGYCGTISNNTILPTECVIGNKGLNINSGTVSILPNSNLLLSERSIITVAPTAGLSIGSNCTITGYNYTVVHDETSPVWVNNGNKIVVYGNLSVSNNVNFYAESDNYWDGLVIDNNNSIFINDATFTKCNLSKKNGQLAVNNSSFIESNISCDAAYFFIEDCSIVGSIYCKNSPSAFILECNVTGQGDGITLSTCADYGIYNSNISGGTGNGISIYETNGISSYHISDCYISDNDGAGIRLYNSIANVTSCSITGNDYQGIAAFRVSNLTIQKDPNTAAYYLDCYIANNGMQEISFVNSTNLFADRAKNMIVDNSFALGTFDQYLVYCPNMETNRWLRLNFWGYRDNHSVAIMPPENRFYPECTEPMFNEVGYYLSPVWDPGIPRIVDPDNDEIVFQTAIDAALDENASLAITLFKQLISEYPESKFCSASAKHLFALEDDKQALKDYYQTEPNLHYNGEIDKIIDYLTTHCNIKLGNYQEAIAWFEDVISNPHSEIDSLMAVIDLGYVYMLMEGDDKASVICRYPQLKPKTMSDYETNRESILVNLFGTVENQAGYTDSEYTEQAIMPVLRSNFPNPFNPTTTISFLLPKDATCTLDVYNIRGQKVKNLINETRFAGNHSVVWNGLDDNGKPVSSGLYFYRLTTPNSSQTNKMLLLK